MNIDWMKYLGKPYQFGARGPDAYDCWGLVRAVYRGVGIDLPEFESVEEAAERQAQVDLAAPSFEALDKPSPLCIVAFRIHPRFVTHVGVVTEDRARFCHITKGANVAIERLDSPLWGKRIAGYYTWKK